MRVSDAIPIDHGKVGVVLAPRDVRTNQRGVPLIPGHYKPVDWKRWVAVRFRDGSMNTYPKGALRPVACDAQDYTRFPYRPAGER